MCDGLHICIRMLQTFAGCWYILSSFQLYFYICINIDMNLQNHIPGMQVFSSFITSLGNY